LVQRYRRRGTTPADAIWQERLHTLAERLHISRPVQLCESTLADVPAVIGWLRPVVLMPATMLTGLSPRQIEALLAHELAHIRRHDYVINLIQTGVETLLFYHPAVWWIGRSIRAERENCCDDMAVRVCGDVLTYARALTRMEQLRMHRPALALGADGGSLLKRIQRLVSSKDAETAGASDWLTAAAVLLCAVVVWGAPRLPFSSITARRGDGVTPSAVYAKFPQLARATRALRAVRALPFRTVAYNDAPMIAGIAPAHRALARPAIAMMPQAAAQPEPPTSEDNGHGFLAGLDAAGYRNLSVDDLIALKQHGVTPAYIRSIEAAGYKPNVDDLVAMAIHGVTPEYIAQMKAQGFKLDVDDLVAFKIHGVDASTIAAIRAMGYKPDADDVVAFQIHGVTPETVRAMKSLGYGDPTLDQLVALQIHGVTPEFANAFKQAGVKGLDFDSLIALKIHGADAAQVRQLHELGFNDLDADDIVALCIHGVTPDYIRKARQHGFKDLSLEQIVKLKQFGILD